LGLTVWALWTCHPVPGSLGLALLLAGVLGLARHLAGARRALEDRQKVLVELNRSLDEQVQGRTARLMQTIEDLESFNRMVTHDLKSPLTGLMLGLDQLQEHIGPGRPDLDRLMDGLRTGADRMEDLLRGLQELALISGQLPAVQRVDVSYHARVVSLNLQEKDAARKVTWEIEPGLIVLGDPNLVRIALENLLGNAWKFTVTRPLAVISVRRGPGSSVEVRDNGIGFDMAMAEAMFQPFRRLHADLRIPGHGIGLSIVKRVMAKHGGRVTAQGWPGEGAAFRLEFSAED